MSFSNLEVWNKDWWSSLTKPQMASTIVVMAAIVIAVVGFILAAIALAKSKSKEDDDNIIKKYSPSNKTEKTNNSNTSLDDKNIDKQSKSF